MYGDTIMQKKLQSMWQDARINIGPFRMKMTLFLNDAGYDSNVYRTYYDPIEDWTFTTGPAFSVYLPLKKRILFLFHESPQYVYFRETKHERTWNHYFNGEVHFYINRFLFSFGKGYSDARQRWNTEIDIRPRLKTDSLMGAVLWQISKKTSFSLRYRHIEYDYENIEYEGINIRRQLNRKGNYINFTGYYQLSYRIKVFVDFEHGIFEFESPQNFRDSKSWGVYSGVEFSPFGVFQGRINLGYTSVYTLDTERKIFEGIAGDAGVSLLLLKHFKVRALYTRGVIFSLGATYFLIERYGGGVSFYLFKNIRLDYDCNMGSLSYPEKQFIADSSWIGREHNLETHSVGVYFRLKENIGIGVTASRWIREYPLALKVSKRDMFGLNLTYDF